FPKGRRIIPFSRKKLYRRSRSPLKYEVSSPVSHSRAKMVPRLRTDRTPGWPVIFSENALCCLAILSIPAHVWGSCSRSRLASEAAHARGLAVKEWPWKNVFSLSLHKNASYNAWVQVVAPNDMDPPVMPLEKQKISGSSCR